MEGVGFFPASCSGMFTDFARDSAAAIIDVRISVISKEVQHDSMEADVICIKQIRIQEIVQ
jgi:hypothetical protein